MSTLEQNQMVVQEVVGHMRKLRKPLKVLLSELYEHAGQICTASENLSEYYADRMVYGVALLQILERASQSLDRVGLSITSDMNIVSDGIFRLFKDAQVRTVSDRLKLVQDLDCLELLLNTAIPPKWNDNSPCLETAPTAPTEFADNIVFAREWLAKLREGGLGLNLVRKYLEYLSSIGRITVPVLEASADAQHFLLTGIRTAAGDHASMDQITFRLLTLSAVKHSVIPCRTEGAEETRGP
jgi:hypothetical protein